MPPFLNTPPKSAGRAPKGKDVQGTDKPGALQLIEVPLPSVQPGSANCLDRFPCRCSRFEGWGRFEFGVSWLSDVILLPSKQPACKQESWMPKSDFLHFWALGSGGAGAGQGHRFRV